MSKFSNYSLFHERTLRDAIAAFEQSFPENLLQLQQQKIPDWIETLNCGTLDEIKEIALHGEFLRDIFQDILGYRSSIQGTGKKWEIEAESTISEGNGFADAALGFFTGKAGEKGKVKLKGRIIAPIELKGAKQDLDRPSASQGESAVDQGWRYANYTPDCQWVIVSNYRELRLYQTSKTPSYFQRFYLQDLADFEIFKRFYFLLCRKNFLPPVNQKISRIDRLLAESNEAEEAITEELYREYKKTRIDLAAHFHNTARQDIENRDAVLIEKAQKTLDRILFIAFCEDRGLLPPKTIRKAHDLVDPYHPRPIWENYKAVFRWVDKGNEDPPIVGYNGGLFRKDPLLDEELKIPDTLCSQIKTLTRFDFATEISVDILGRIFEQSVTDLEELRALARGEKYDKKIGKRKERGVFYTPAFITQYIVKVTLGNYLQEKEAELRENLAKNSKNEEEFWQTYRDEILLKIKIVDPACGSGAFLIAAFDYLVAEYKRVNEALSGLLGEIEVDFDGETAILQQNLYGVDLSAESVEITKLSLWLQTAKSQKPLADLDGNIKMGNSLIKDVSIDRYGFDWEKEFPAVFAEGGFDVVIGNPPYVRQELLKPYKDYFQKHYHSYHGMADLYTYFYEKGIKLLKSGRILAYIVTNKWLRSQYGEKLREFFVENSTFEQIVDFGHAPIFQDAETFPCIVSLRKQKQPESSVLVCPVPREELAEINLPQYVQKAGYNVPWSRFSREAWNLEPPEVVALMQKIWDIGIPLKEFAGVKPYRGVLTGLNEAFLIDEETKHKIVRDDPKSAEVIKPYLRGQDIKRWSPEWDNQWLIFTRRGIDIDDYPAIKTHLSQYRTQLEPRPKKWDAKKKGKWLGRKNGSYQWYEIQDTVDYWQYFESPKIIYQVIQTLPYYAFDDSGLFGNDKTFILPSCDRYLLGCLNSPLLWWYGHRIFTKMLSGSISPMGYLFETLPIASPSPQTRQETEEIVSQLIELTQNNQNAYQDVLDWFKIEQNILKPGKKLSNFANLNPDEFMEEVKKRKPKKSLSIHELRHTREVYQEFTPAIQTRNAEIKTLEYRLSNLINTAYQLTPEEIELLWKTAPPRMPIALP
jgi:type I restriction-modification system DNA methylase subunit